MRRTKPTKKDQEDLTPPHDEFGGHMPRPPLSCPAPKVISSITRKRYVDCTYCANCKHSKTCKRWNVYAEEWKSYRKRFSRIKAKYNHAS